VKRLREALEIVLLVAFIGFILLVAYFTIHGARKVKALGDEASSTLSNLNRTIVIASGAFTNIEKGGRAWKENSDAQAKVTTDALRSLSASAKSLDGLISSTDRSLNLSLLPSLSRAIDDQNEALKKSEANIDAVVTVATATIEDADRQIANPRIAESVDNLADSSKSLSIATASGAASMQKVQQGVEYEVNSLMKPVRKAKAVLLFVVTMLGHFFGYA
jgi:hypothetical protein